MYTERSLTAVLKKFSSLYPAIGITGPRQSGKTTLARQCFAELPYVSLEDLDTRLYAQNDPRAFLANYESEGAIFDEIQHTPELLSYLQGILDKSSKKGRFILTGSENFALNNQIAQSLPGRIGMTTLLPLSMKELSFPAITSSIFRGGYPGLYSAGMHPLDFYPSYIQTYVERDIRQLKNIENFGVFQNFLKLCAGRIGQIVNFSSLAVDAGISHTTARQWLNVLQASYLVFFLQPFYNNFSKRVIKMPKLYFYDTGLACALLGLEKEAQYETHYLKGALFENLIILELLKKRLNQGLSPNLYFWRDHTGREIDLLGEWGGDIYAIEIKAGATFQPAYIKAVHAFLKLAGSSKKVQGYLVYTGEQEGMYRDVKLVPVQKIDTSF